MRATVEPHCSVFQCLALLHLTVLVKFFLLLAVLTIFYMYNYRINTFNAADSDLIKLKAPPVPSLPFHSHKRF